MKYGLPLKAIQGICAVFTDFPAILKAVLYGSRAMGNFKPESDIDLTLYGEDLTQELLTSISLALDDLLLPYSIDLSICADIENVKLREHIDQAGLVFYKRTVQLTEEKKGWVSQTIGEVCDLVNGGTPKTKQSEYWDGPHQWITPAEMGKRNTPFISNTQRTITNDGLNNSSAKLLPPYSVILSSRAPIGHLVINLEPMATNQGCKGLIPRQSIDYKFLYYYLFSIVDLLNDLGSGATFKELSGSKLRDVHIPFPPLPEQHRIVRILDEAFEAIATAKANAEKNLRNAREVFESHLNAVFTQRGEGGTRNLGDLCQIVGGGTPPKNRPDFYSGNIPWATVRDMRQDILSDTEFRITKDAVKSSSTNIIPEGNVIIATRVGLGKVCLLNQDTAINQDLRGIIPRAPGSLNVRYLFWWLKNISDRIISEGTGATVQGVKLPFIKSLQIPCLPLPEQHRIVEMLDSLSLDTSKLSFFCQQKLTALDDLKQSLLHNAFTGEL
jgi:type I restriction enzyme S subunit